MIRRLSLSCLCAVLPAAAQIPAFPGAEGYGGYSKGGRGGDVYIVTNLSGSSIPGSFRYGIETVPAAGRTIVFAVSGHIHINGLRLVGSNVTIAGQTAPGDGVGLVDGTFRISGDDVVVRHLRFRHRKTGSGGDCVNLDSGSINSVLDSVSMQFSTDENFSSFNSPPENLTMQWSLNAWGLESHSCGGLWDQNHATCHHSLWAHNHTRNPKARPSGLLEWTNNVTFDWDIGFIMGDSETPASWKANVIGNYFLSPPGNTRSKALEKATVDRNGNPNFSVHLSNNRHDSDGDGILNGTDKGYSIVAGSEFQAGDPVGANRYVKALAPFANTGSIPVTTDDPLLAFKKVVSKSGALRLDIDPAKPLRDEVDTRLVQNLVNQTANHITRESDLAGVSNGGIGTLNATAAPLDIDLDGMPDYYESALGWNPAAQDHNAVLANSGGFLTGTTFMPAATPAGYTRLEEYLHFLAIPHGTVAKNTASEPTSVQVDLQKFTSGFQVSPVFSVSNISGGGIAQSGPGNHLVTFTPTLNHVGRARFDFTVTDAAGHSWTQTCALLVTNAGLPRDLKWVGGLASNAWDSATNNWSRNGTATAFSFGDRVAFDDSGSKTPAINVTGTVSPASVDVDAAGNYSTTGTGSIASSGPLVKRGTGTLTLANSGANSFSAVTLESGALTLGNSSSIGNGPLRIEGGTLNMGATDPGNATTIAGPATITGGDGGGAHGLGVLTGSAPLTIQQTNVFDLEGDMSGYSGTVTFTGNSAVRIFGSAGSAAATFHLGNGTTSLSKRSNITSAIPLGGLAGGAGTTLSGASGGGNTTTTHYQIGGNGSSTVFSGSITNGGGTTSITKTGAGTLTLGGTGSHTGATAVSQGGLLVDGSLGNTAVTVASGALLGGDGSFAGPIIANAGAFLSPGTVPFTGATLVANNGLTLGGNTLYFDMANTPGAGNDAITMSGTLAMTGTQYFQFLLLQGPLQAGTYDLITGATHSTINGVSLTHNLPNDSRQTFALGRSPAGSNPSKIWLTVTGNPATLTWTGAANGTWDTVTANNWTGATPDKFYNNDDVSLDDTAATRNVTLSGTVAPRTATITTTLGYTIGGTGSLGGNAALTKNGSGTLTFANTTANTFSGGLTLNGGTIALANDTANAGALGTGPVTLNAGVLSMFDEDNSFNSFTAALVVPTAATARINADSRVDVHGTLAGGGTLNFYVPWVRTTLFSNWSAFTGTINVLTDAGGGDFRMGTSYSFPGFPQAAIALTDKVSAYYTGTLAEGAGTTIPIGSISGTSLSVLQGGATGGRALTYRIGGKNTDATFAGTISEQNTATATTYIKTGTGTWTLSGSGAWNGGTNVEQGTLRLSGTFTSAAATQVFPGAALKIEGGNLTTDATNIAGGAFFYGYGKVASDFISDGTTDGRGFVTGTPGTLTVQGSMFLGGTSLTRLRGGASSDLVAVTGDLALGGTLQVSLAPGSGFGRYPLFTYGGTLSGTATLAENPDGPAAHLSTAVTGRVDLVIDDTDEDGLPDSWEVSNFGNLTQGPADDPDGDGQNNSAELLAGTLPNSGASRFAATITPLNASQFLLTWPSIPGNSYQIQSTGSFSLGWDLLATVPAADSPATTTSHTVTAGPSTQFYRIVLQP